MKPIERGVFIEIQNSNNGATSADGGSSKHRGKRTNRGAKENASWASTPKSTSFLPAPIVTPTRQAGLLLR